MGIEDFERYLDDIKKIPEDKLEDYASILKEKVKTLSDEITKIAKQTILIVLAYFLIKNSFISDIKIGPFDIRDIRLILSFVPLAVALMINNASLKFYSVNYNNFFLSLILRRLFKLNERTLLLSNILPLSTENASFRAQKKRLSLFGCLFKLPLAMITLFLALFLIPFFFYFVISSVFNFYSSGNELSIWFFWIPNFFAFYLLLLGILNGINLLNFILLKSKFYDQEDKKNKHSN